MTMLRRHRLFEHGGISLDEVTCRHRPGRGRSIESSTGHALVFVRRGCFIRSTNGHEALLDPTVAFCSNPGEELRYDHPHVHGDDCTAVSLDPALVASLWGGRPALPAGALPSSPQIDLEHRLLLAAARRHAEPAEVIERSIALAASALERVDRRPVQSGRPSTAGARRALAEGAREALAADPGIPLPRLARELAVSPHHLSRIFRSQTGHTLTRHRMRLRARQALERMACGDHDLAGLASDLGFADQSHLCRVIRSETGYPPGALRRHL
jgi:AraC-like DNA-binding protein